MIWNTLNFKLIGIGLIGFACFIASLMVLGLVSEREARHDDVKSEIAATWGAKQAFIGPMLVFKQTDESDVYLLPSNLNIESTVEPEIRTRGIFETVVYTQHIKVNGTFSASDILAANVATRTPMLVASISDTRSIEKQIMLNWRGTETPYNPGVNSSFLETPGIHALVPIPDTKEDYTFSFELTLKGSEQVMFAPLGKENEVKVSAPWGTPEFTGAFLPAQRNITNDAFDASWRVSSFGRSYPQKFTDDGTVAFAAMNDSVFGVNLNEGVDFYTQISRGAKYAILFIVVTFIAFFLFEVLSKVQLHSIQYLLIGLALALFYLLLLSLSEHVGFLKAYVLATTMTSLLISAYSAKVLVKPMRALAIFGLLLALYACLYFILNLEDYALLFGSLLLFALLSAVMYLTRNIEWFALVKNTNKTDVGK